MLESLLVGLPIPQMRCFHSIGSTNDEALLWAAQGAPDGCLVIADVQTRGRGRFNRRWVTTPGASLAFSLILRPQPEEMSFLSLFSPLGALSICHALETPHGLKPTIKWPNDVLLDGRKTAGILVEAAWTGERMDGIVIGIGMNISRASVPPADTVMFPATCLEEAAGQTIDRWAVLEGTLKGVFALRARLGEERFHREWWRRLAFRNEWVRVSEGEGGKTHTGRLVGLDADGSLLLQGENDDFFPVAVGDVHLRQAE
jgi:BirA family biotin operon repressor/biotin-[acetyl-CoA-carboxylase] ligase